MNRCVVDTNAIVYYLNQVGGEDFRQRFDQWVRVGAVISIVTRIEVLSWPEYSTNPAALGPCRSIAIHAIRGTPYRTDCQGNHSLAPSLPA